MSNDDLPEWVTGGTTRAKAKEDFKYFAESDMIDQSMYKSESTPDGIVIKDVHMGWVNAIEQENISRLALTAFTGSGKCVTGDTMVPMADGTWKRIIEVEEGEKVLSFNEQSHELEASKVSRFYENGVKDVYKVKSRNGREVKVTSNHPFYTAEGWKSIDEGLSEGDCVMQPSKTFKRPNKTEDDRRYEDIRWGIIKDIEYVGKEDTYDITVPKNHSFIADGFVTHNTTILGVLYPLWRLVFRADDILIVSNNITKSRDILEEIKMHIENSDELNYLKPENPKHWSRDHMKCTNGSNVYVRPFNDSAKGVHVDYAIVDEAAELGDMETYQKAVKTRINRKNGDICLISTPVHENDVMARLSEGVQPALCPHCYEEVEKDGGDSICKNESCDYYEEKVDELFDPKISEMGYWNDKFKIMDEDGNPNFPEAFDKKDISRLKREDPVAFQREYMCEYTTIGGELFDPNDVVNCYDSDEAFESQPREGCSYVMGVDFAVSKQGDYSVYTILESDPEREEKAVIRNIERIQGMRLQDQEERIKNLHDIYKFDSIVVDATNFGEPTFRSLRDAGLPVQGQSFEPSARNPLLIALRKAFENGEIVVPRKNKGRTRDLTNKLHNELMGFGVSETRNGSVTYKSTSKHDDLPISLAMANKAVKEKKPVVSMVAY